MAFSYTSKELMAHVARYLPKWLALLDHSHELISRFVAHVSNPFNLSYQSRENMLELIELVSDWLNLVNMAFLQEDRAEILFKALFSGMVALVAFGTCGCVLGRFLSRLLNLLETLVKILFLLAKELVRPFVWAMTFGAVGFLYIAGNVLLVHGQSVCEGDELWYYRYAGKHE
ncbi:uncharacterized protein K452DRAFT_332414 [Aplosporella prunicola CBS 121167]|uniref:Uncharacterized protein n=1 Tax=Aplosporella prunicola CBS 121167 TaxID=1176127 RepID=A0A6A6BJA7_9PEZI|nr:uncharacterized protein K452DRAFT_332414 [Aplosporella prunicola CBS 121167]KAF2142651.1 hypothetical protein K452DRAFT_332414 [Aplosporella prunicola CBS 121167]